MSAPLDHLLRQIRACRLCEQHLPLGPRPVLQAGTGARLLIVGQAPGTRVHGSGVPWDDRSGERLRDWLQMDAAMFYDAARVAIVPVGFCYPGKAGSGDAPPRRECRTTWHPQLLPLLPQVELTLLVGAHAQSMLLPGMRQPTLTAAVRGWRGYLPRTVPLPHPSPRNVAWFQNNPWFEADVLPYLRERVRALLASPPPRSQGPQPG